MQKLAVDGIEAGTDFPHLGQCCWCIVLTKTNVGGNCTAKKKLAQQYLRTGSGRQFFLGI